MAAAELAGPVLPRGRSDLLREIISAIKAGEPVDIDIIELIEDKALLSPGWRELMAALEGIGIQVKPVSAFVPVEAGTDIGILHHYIRTGERSALTGDGTVAEIQANTALMAAECVAEWIASKSDDASRETVIIAPDGDSTLLDQAFARHGLPRLGLSPSSAYRGALQVLSLAFAAAWKPVDPRKLLELLLLPRPPIRRWAARILADAISKEPGINGPAWQKAWRRIEERLREQEATGEKIDVDAILQKWRSWVEGERFERNAGMPAANAIAICQRVRDWAVELDSGNRDPLLLCVVGAARALIDALRALGQSPVTGLLVDRMIDHAIAEGLPNPDHIAEEGTIRVVSSPGALWGGAARVVWWNFAGDAATSAFFPWSKSEHTALGAAGSCPERPADAAQREAFHWQSVILNTRTAILFVRPELSRGTEAKSHPLAHQLAPVFGPDCDAIRLPAERLLVQERVPLAAREIIRSSTIMVELPQPQPIWSLPAAVQAKMDGRKESATSFEDLLSCQMRWVLKHVAGLRADSARSIPDSERLFGNLAHALTEIVFVPGAIPDPDEVQRKAQLHFDDLVEKIAAPLLLPGLAAELAFARDRIPDALKTLADFLNRQRFTVEGLEVEREQEFGELQVKSRIDMVVRDPSDRRAVIDLKWTRSNTRRRKEIENGRAIQLATYSRLVDPQKGAPAAYFLIRQRRLLAEAGSPLALEEIDVSDTLDDTWSHITSDWNALIQAGRNGQGFSYGIPGIEAHLPVDLSFPPEGEVCKFCDFSGVCRAP
jgi:RecB family exonuclease